MAQINATVLVENILVFVKDSFFNNFSTFNNNNNNNNGIILLKEAFYLNDFTRKKH